MESVARTSIPGRTAVPATGAREQAGLANTAAAATRRTHRRTCLEHSITSKFTAVKNFRSRSPSYTQR